MQVSPKTGHLPDSRLKSDAHKLQCREGILKVGAENPATTIQRTEFFMGKLAEGKGRSRKELLKGIVERYSKDRGWG